MVEQEYYPGEAYSRRMISDFLQRSWLDAYTGGSIDAPDKRIILAQTSASGVAIVVLVSPVVRNVHPVKHRRRSYNVRSPVMQPFLARPPRKVFALKQLEIQRTGNGEHREEIGEKC